MALTTLEAAQSASTFCMDGAENISSLFDDDKFLSNPAFAKETLMLAYCARLHLLAFWLRLNGESSPLSSTISLVAANNFEGQTGLESAVSDFDRKLRAIKSMDFGNNDDDVAGSLSDVAASWLLEARGRDCFIDDGNLKNDLGTLLSSEIEEFSERLLKSIPPEGSGGMTTAKRSGLGGCAIILLLLVMLLFALYKSCS